MDSKKVIGKLIKIAEKQQKIIEKLAQQQVRSFTPSETAAPATTTPPADMKPSMPTKREADVILAAIAVKPALKGVLTPNGIEVRPGTGGAPATVWVKFAPGKLTQPNYDAVKQVVFELQTNKELPGTSYNVKYVR